jgi:formylglycine-generating enzyme
VRYAWGDQARPGGVLPANTWSGRFPVRPADAAYGTTPVGAYPANGYGLLDVIGNVWEWTADRYTPGHRKSSCCDATDPLAVGGPLYVAKGGSFLCADEYCSRYRPAARIPQAVDASAANLGFRCVRR